MANPNTRSWEVIRRQMPLNEARVLAYQRLMQADVRLSGLRRRRGLIKATLADMIDGSQLAEDDDLYLSTLGRYVATLGGHLEVRAVFPEAAVTLLTLPAEEDDSASA
jgi:hypothetical protein